MPTVPELRARLEVFLRWWAAELWASLPESWRQRLRHRTRHFVLRFQEEAERVAVTERGVALAPRTFALQPKDAEEAKSLTEIQRAIRREGARLDALVPEVHIVRREMKLPSSAQDNLRDALAADLDRYTRFQARDVYFDYSVAVTDSEAKTITVNTSIVPRHRVDDMVTVLRRAGLNPTGVYGGRAGPSRHDATFLKVKPEKSPAAVRALTFALVALVLALDVAAAYVPFWIKLDAISDMQARIQSIKTDLEDAARLEQTLRELRGQNLYLVNLKRQAPSMAEIVGEVARVLPDSAWLDQLQVREGRLQLAGFSSATPELISALEQSPLLSEVRFEWPVMPASMANIDRFDISARIVPSPGEH